MYDTSWPAMRTVSSTASLWSAFAVLPLAAEVVAEQQVVVGVEQDAHRGAVAEVGIEADDGDVVDDGRAHHAGDLRFRRRRSAVGIARCCCGRRFEDEHVAEVALPVAA